MGRDFIVSNKSPAKNNPGTKTTLETTHSRKNTIPLFAESFLVAQFSWFLEKQP